MIFKSYIIEKDLKKVKRLPSIFILWRKSWFKKRFKRKFKKTKIKDNEVINLFQSDVIKNKNILINEISNQSLFNEKKNNIY